MAVPCAPPFTTALAEPESSRKFYLLVWFSGFGPCANLAPLEELGKLLSLVPKATAKRYYFSNSETRSSHSTSQTFAMLGLRDMEQVGRTERPNRGPHVPAISGLAELHIKLPQSLVSWE